MNIDEFAMDTAGLAGALEAKLKAMHDAGFGQVMLGARDMAGHPGGFDAAVQAVRASGLRATGFQALRDFEGLSGSLHAYKVGIAKQMIEMCAALGCKLLLARSSTNRHASADAQVLARDLAKLATLAVPHGIRIAYQPLSWARHVRSSLQAWDIVAQADMPNLGLALDAFHLFAAKESLDDLELLDPQRIHVVELADLMWHDEPPDEGHATADARTFRVFPGEGVHGEQIVRLVLALDQLGYAGDYSFNVVNDDYRQLPPPAVCARARRAAVWLAEDVLKRSVPLPGAPRLQVARRVD
jgi:4-hydroxyphenylpyruvate dioxygenase